MYHYEKRVSVEEQIYDVIVVGGGNSAASDALYLSRHFRARVRREPAFGSMPVLLTTGYRRRASASLYERAELAEFDETEIRLIPYACFANRGPSDMLVWMNAR